MVEIHVPNPIWVTGRDRYLFNIFLQIYKLSGSYIKECKNHFQKFENFFEIPVFWEFRV